MISNRSNGKNFLFLGLLIVLLANAVVAIPDNGVAFYNFSDTLDDSWNGFDANATALTYSTDYPSFSTSGDAGPKAGDFDGSSTYVTFDGALDNQVLHYDQGWSIALWIKPDTLPSAGSQKNIISNYQAGSKAFRVDLGNPGTSATDKLKVYLADGGANTGVLQSTATINIDTYHLIILNYNSSNKSIELTINNTEDVTGSASFTADFFDAATTQFQVGRTYTASQYFDGRIDHIKMFNKTLTTEEKSNLWSSGSLSAVVEGATPQIVSRSPSNGSVTNTSPRLSVTPSDNDSVSLNVSFYQGFMNLSAVHTDTSPGICWNNATQRTWVVYWQQSTNSTMREYYPDNMTFTGNSFDSVIAQQNCVWEDDGQSFWMWSAVTDKLHHRNSTGGDISACAAPRRMDGLELLNNDKVLYVNKVNKKAYTINKTCGEDQELFSVSANCAADGVAVRENDSGSEVSYFVSCDDDHNIQEYNLSGSATGYVVTPEYMGVEGLDFRDYYRLLHAQDTHGDGLVNKTYQYALEGKHLSTTSTSNNTLTSFVWDELLSAYTYHWYVVLDDGENTNTAETWTLTTQPLQDPALSGSTYDYSSPLDDSENLSLSATYTDPQGDDGSVLIQWYLNDVLHTSENASATNGSQVSSSFWHGNQTIGDVLRAELTPTDSNSNSGSTTVLSNVTVEDINFTAVVNGPYSYLYLYSTRTDQNLPIWMETSINLSNNGNMNGSDNVTVTLDHSALNATAFINSTTVNNYSASNAALQSADSSSINFNSSSHLIVQFNISSAPSSSYSYYLEAVRGPNDHGDVLMVKSVNGQNYSTTWDSKTGEDGESTTIQEGQTQLWTTTVSGVSFPFVQGINNITLDYVCGAEVCNQEIRNYSIDQVRLQEHLGDVLTVQSVSGKNVTFTAPFMDSGQSQNATVRFKASGAITFTSSTSTDADSFTETFTVNSTISTLNISSSTLIYRLPWASNYVDAGTSVQVFNESIGGYEELSITKYFIDTDADGDSDFLAFFQPHTLGSWTYRITGLLSSSGSGDSGSSGDGGSGGSELPQSPTATCGVDVREPEIGLIETDFCPSSSVLRNVPVTLYNPTADDANYTVSFVGEYLDENGTTRTWSCDDPGVLSVNAKQEKRVFLENCACPPTGEQMIGQVVVHDARAGTCEEKIPVDLVGNPLGFFLRNIWLLIIASVLVAAFIVVVIGLVISLKK